jgi:hypothetical protein
LLGGFHLLFFLLEFFYPCPLPEGLGLRIYTRSGLSSAGTRTIPSLAPLHRVVRELTTAVPPQRRETPVAEQRNFRQSPYQQSSTQRSDFCPGWPQPRRFHVRLATHACRWPVSGGATTHQHRRESASFHSPSSSQLHSPRNSRKR